jgi:hypothetical protein
VTTIPHIGEPDPTVLTRRNLRHALMRRRNERIAAAGPRYDEPPAELFLSPATREDLLKDGDPDEAKTIDFLGEMFCGVPLIEDGRLAKGQFVVRWGRLLPEEAAAAAAAGADGHTGEEPIGG